jgi:hypothetical protein
LADIEEEFRHDPAYRIRPAMFMPRWASRILLAIDEIGIERVQDINELDAAKEGAQVHRVNMPAKGFKMGDALENRRDVFRCLWNSINKAPGRTWEDNPFVWVIQFHKIGS